MFKRDIQEAFQKGFEDVYGKIEETILPEKDIDRSLVDEQLPYKDTWLSLKYALEDRLEKMQEGGGKNG